MQTIFDIVVYTLAIIGLLFLIAVVVIANMINRETYDQAEIKELTTEAELFQHHKKD
jgi:hypothetical protein